MPNTYRIRVQGHLDYAIWALWFDSLRISNLPHGEAEIVGQIEDEAGLHSVLQKVRDLGLPLLSANKVQKGNDGD